MKTITGTPRELSTQLFVLEPDKVYEIREYKELRGLQANKYFHKLVNELARYNRSIGYAISDEEMKINMNLSYGTIDTFDDGKVKGAKVPKGTNMQEIYEYSKWYKTEDECDCYIFYKRTHLLNTSEFTQLIRGVEVECKNVGIKTLDDLEFEKMMNEYEREWLRNDYTKKNGRKSHVGNKN